MDFWLSFGCTLSHQDLQKMLYDIISDVFVLEVNTDEAKVWDVSDNECIRVGSTYFSINTVLEDEEYIERYQKEKFKMYGVNTNMFSSIEFISRTFETGWPKFMEVVGKLLECTDQDLIIEDGYGCPLLKRIQGDVFINSRLDEEEEWYVSSENLKILKYSTKKEILFLRTNLEEYMKCLKK